MERKAGFTYMVTADGDRDQKFSLNRKVWQIAMYQRSILSGLLAEASKR